MSIIRRVVVTLLCFVGAACMRSWGGHLPWQLWLPTGLLLASALLVHHRHVGSQMLARAVLWSNLLLGSLILAMGDMREGKVAMVLAGATGLALLVLGRNGLKGEVAGGRFVPIAFRATLVTILVLALADAQTLMLFGSLFAENLYHGQATTAVVALGLAALLTASMIGLYRLRVWGLMLNTVACAALIAVAAAGVMGLPGIFNTAFVVSGALQIVLVARLFLAIAIRSRPSRSLPAAR